MELWEESLRELKKQYARRSAERLKQISDALVLLESNLVRGEALKDLAHCFHGLAGSGKTYGFPEATEIGQRGEEAVDTLLREEAPPTPADLAEFREMLSRLQMLFSDQS